MKIKGVDDGTLSCWNKMFSSHLQIQAASIDSLRKIQLRPTSRIAICDFCGFTKCCAENDSVIQLANLRLHMSVYPYGNGRDNHCGEHLCLVYIYIWEHTFCVLLSHTAIARKVQKALSKKTNKLFDFCSILNISVKKCSVHFRLDPHSHFCQWIKSTAGNHQVARVWKRTAS